MAVTARPDGADTSGDQMPKYWMVVEAGTLRTTALPVTESCVGDPTVPQVVDTRA